MDNGSCINNNCGGFLNCVGNLIRQEPITDYYNVDQRPFARGKFATVRRCRHKETNIDYAAKFIRKRRRAMDVRHEIFHEIAVLELCRSCQYIVRLHEVYEMSNEIVLVLELAAGGEVQRLIDEDEILEEKDVVRVMRQILEGISFMHDRNIAHLDIKVIAKKKDIDHLKKLDSCGSPLINDLFDEGLQFLSGPQNLLFTNAYPHCDIKLCDFGISRVITKGIEIREIMGTPDYVAPEVLNYEPINLATDMWSIGVLTYVLLTGHSPFAGDSKQETFCNISHVHLDFPEDLFDGISAQAKDFIRKLLQKDPSVRLTARECLNHVWLRQEPSETTAVLKSPITSQRPTFRCPQQSRESCDKENINVDQLELKPRMKFNDFNGLEVVC